MYQDDRVTIDSLNSAKHDADLSVPSTLKSVGMNFSEAATALPRAIFDMHNALRGLPGKNPLDDSFEVFNQAMDTPNTQWTQKTADFFAAGIGYINPLTNITLINPALKGVSAATGAISRYIPQAATTFARTPIKSFSGPIAKYLPDTIGGAGEHIAKSMAVGTSISAPQALLDNYDEKTNTFNMWGAAEQSFSGGLLAIGIDAIPVTAGAIFGKYKKAIGEEIEHPMPGDAHEMGKFDKALEDGHISPDEHDWIKTYLENPDDVELLKEKGIAILQKDGYPVDTAKQKVMMNLMKKEHYDDFHTGMLDQISSGASGDFKSTLSDYVAASSLDFMTAENSQFLDGFKGYVDFMEKRLLNESKNLDRFDKVVKESKLEHIDSEHPMSQKNLFKELKQVGLDVKRVPHAVPSSMRYRIKQEADIKKLKRSIKLETSEEKIQQLKQSIHDIKLSRQKMKSPNRELSALKEHFLGKDELPKNYRDTHEYHRLIDLSHFSQKADALLHHIHVKDQYKVQTAYKDLVKFLNNVIGSNVNKFSDPNKVVSYFRSRLDSVAQSMEETPNVTNKKEIPITTGKRAFSDIKKKDELYDMNKDLRNDVTHDEEILGLNEIDVDSAQSEEYSKLYKVAKDRYVQFKDNEEVLHMLVSCELGSKGEAV